MGGGVEMVRSARYWHGTEGEQGQVCEQNSPRQAKQNGPRQHVAPSAVDVSLLTSCDSVPGLGK